jgi:pimeloyl-ACP methyl ester carboxylesterase
MPGATLSAGVKGFDGFFDRGDAVIPKGFVLDLDSIDRALLDRLQGSDTPQLDERWLLPKDYIWRTPEGACKVPFALCEMVAYKAALAYGDEKEIREYLPRTEGPFAFFDSSKTTKVADTQGFAFIYNGIIFIIMRGSEMKAADWRTNFEDEWTTDLQTNDRRRLENFRLAKLVRRLKKKHGANVARYIDRLREGPPRHMGFAIAWAAVEEEVRAFLDQVRARQGAPDMPIVISGHSLGGALALIGAAELKRAKYNVEGVVTFGAPQVGGKEFSTEYERDLDLKRCTVEFDAAGDSVPRLLRRWYFQLDRGRQLFVERLIFRAKPKQSVRFFVSGNTYEFNVVPPLSAFEVESAIGAIRREALENAAKAFEKSEPGKAKQGKEVPGKPQSGTGSGSSAGGDGRAVIAIIVGIAVVIVILLTWIFVRYKLRSHAIMERYALYLSTVSYGQIRALYAADPRPATERLTSANADLKNYLAFVRGRDDWLNKKDRPLPVRLNPDLDVKTYLSRKQNII